MTTTHIGIDPGANGGTAVIYPTGDVVTHNHKGTTLRDYCDELRSVIGWGSSDVFALLEVVHAMPGQGVTSMFTFGRELGQRETALTAIGIPFERVRPQDWQREFGLVFTRKHNLTNTQKKNRHKAKAQELFPAVRVTHAIADALLIAEYARRRFGGAV